MRELIEKRIGCPYCGETITLLVDDSVPEQSYTEDCQVCCRPMLIDVAAGPAGNPIVSAKVEND